MRFRAPIWLLACATLMGCASASSEGGVTGTGISAISGNIVQVSGPQVQVSDPLP